MKLIDLCRYTLRQSLTEEESKYEKEVENNG